MKVKRKTDGEPKTTKKKMKRRQSAVLEAIHINPEYTEESYMEKFRNTFEKPMTPFPHWYLKDFVENSEKVVEKVEEELQNFEDWQRKENDLYSLYQTNDLKSLDPITHPAIFSFRQFLYTEVKQWLQKATGVELTDQVDCNGSCYAKTDTLLPHNDLIETRRFAFVFYMTDDNWNSKENGGDLVLFNHDKKSFQPTTVAGQYAPARNHMMIFEVSQKSWHRVAEMLSEEPRLSINGWFHSARRLEAKRPKVETIERFIPETKCKLMNLIGKEYLQTERQNEVQKTFSESSELNLAGFLTQKIHDQVYLELSGDRALFKTVGPVSKRHVARLNEEKAENLTATSRVLECLKSRKFARLAEKLTGVTVTGAQTSVKVSRVEHGTYWVLGDEDAEQSASDGYCVDVHLFVQKTAWHEEAGGELIYIEEGDTEELLRISPSTNAASIVFREPGVISFLKYANCKASEPFFLFTVSYYNVNVVDD